MHREFGGLFPRLVLLQFFVRFSESRALRLLQCNSDSVYASLFLILPNVSVRALGCMHVPGAFFRTRCDATLSAPAQYEPRVACVAYWHRTISHTQAEL